MNALPGISSLYARLRTPTLLLARLALGAVMVAAGALKVGDPVGSVMAVRAYKVLPLEVAKIVGYGLPWVEIAIGALLLAGLATRFAAITTGVFLAVFIVGIAQAWARGLSIDCGCFGGGGEIDPAGKAWRYASEILRDLGLLGLAALLAYNPLTRFSLDRALHPTGEPTA